MTRKEFIEVLERNDYSYKMEGNKIVVTHRYYVDLKSLTSLPPGVQFKNEGCIYLDSLETIPPGVEFKNTKDDFRWYIFERGGSIVLNSVKTLPPGMIFENEGSVFLKSLETLPPGVEFKNLGAVNLESLKSLPPGVKFENTGTIFFKSLKTIPPWVEFNNGGDHNFEVYFGSMLIRSFIDKESFDVWKGNIEGIRPKRILNKMIGLGLFDK